MKYSQQQENGKAQQQTTKRQLKKHKQKSEKHKTIKKHIKINQEYTNKMSRRKKILT